MAADGAALSIGGAASAVTHLQRSSRMSKSIDWVYLFGMLRIMSVVRAPGLRPSTGSNAYCGQGHTAAFTRLVQHTLNAAYAAATTKVNTLITPPLRA